MKIITVKCLLFLLGIFTIHCTTSGTLDIHLFTPESGSNDEGIVYEKLVLLATLHQITQNIKETIFTPYVM